MGKPKSIVFSPLPPPELGQLAKESRLKATQSKPLRAAKIFNIIQVQLEKSSSTPDYFPQNSKTSKIHACLFACLSSIGSCTITEI